GRAREATCSLEEIRHAARTRDEQLAIVAHDLKTPLASISLSAELLGISLSTGAHADAARHVERIARSVSFVDRLVHDVLDARALERGALTINAKPQPIDTAI